MQGLMGDCGAPGSAVCWKVRGCVGVCDGVVTVPAVAWSRGGDVEHREPKTGRILLQVSFLYPSSSHCFTPSPSQMNKTDLALSPHPTPKIHLQNVCFHASWNNIVTCLGLFFYLLRSGLLCRTSRIFTEELSKSGTVLCSGPCFACNWQSRAISD